MAVSAGRALFRAADLLELAELIGRLSSRSGTDVQPPYRRVLDTEMA